MRYIFILLIATFFTSCSETSEVKVEELKVEKEEKVEKQNEGVRKDTISCCPDLVSLSPFDNDSLVIDQIKDFADVDVSFEVYNNRHVDNAKDTVFHFMFNNSNISYYKVHGEAWISKMQLNSSALKTKFGVGVGDDFFEIKGLSGCEEIDSTTKVFIISDIEGLTNITFLLNEGVIESIIYAGYID